MPLLKKNTQKENSQEQPVSQNPAELCRAAGRSAVTTNILAAVTRTPITPILKPAARAILLTGKALDTEDPTNITQVVAGTVGEAAQLMAVGAILTPLVTSAAAVGATLTTGPALLLGTAVAVIGSKVAQQMEPLDQLVTDATQIALDTTLDVITNERVGRSHLDDVPGIADTIVECIGGRHLATARSHLSSTSSTKQSSSAKVQSISESRQKHPKEKEYLKEQREKLDRLSELTISPPPL